jgi:hypothetical protein
MCVANVFNNRCPAECRVVWYGGGLPIDAMSSRTWRAGEGGIAGAKDLGFRILRGEGMLGERGPSLRSVVGGVVVDIIGLTGRRLTCCFRGG